MDEMVKYLDFKNAELSEVIERLENVYNCKFKIASPEIAEHLLTANFYNNNMEDILNILEVTMNISATINKDGKIVLRNK